MNISENPILILSEDGTSIPFSADELQRQLAECAEQAGIDDPDMSRDIALAIEWTIRQKCRKNASSLVRAADINLLVFQILKNLGYDKVALFY